MSSRAHSHNVTLVGAHKEQDARLTLDEGGITFTDPHAKRDALIAHIQWPFVFKICRSRNPCDTADRQGYAVRMLDIVVRTASGLQDLRVACASRAAAEKLLSGFQARIAAYTEEAMTTSWQHAASSPAFSRAASFVRTHRPVLGQVPQISPDIGLLPNTSGAAANAPFLDLENDNVGAQLDELPSATTALLGRPPSATAEDADQLRQAYQRIMFLEDYISRLTAKLSALNQQPNSAEPGDLEPTSPAEDMTAERWGSILELEKVRPLLAAYDNTIERLQAKLQDRQDEVLCFEQRLEQISSRNSGLLEMLKAAMQEAAQNAIADGTRAPDENAERLDLLQRENGLLTKQNAQLEKEVVRLQSEQETLSQRCISATESSHTASARLRAKEAEVESMSVALSTIHTRTDQLEAKLAETDAAKASTEALAQEVLDLRQQVEQLHLQRIEALKSAEESAAAATALRVDVETSREEAEAAIREAEAADTAAEELRITAEGLRCTVAEHRVKETEMYASIQEAVEATEQAKLARDAAKANERQLHEEVASLQKQYAEAAAQLAASSSAQGASDAAHTAELKRARQAVVQHEATISNLQATVTRMEKEKRALQASLVSGSGGGSAEALANLRRALDAERECEASKLQLEAARRSAQQVRLEEEIRVKKMEAQLEEASRKIRVWSASTVDSRHDVTVLTQQLDTTRRELESVRTALTRTNDMAGTTLASVRSEHLSDVQLLSVKLEETISAYNRSVAEAERMMSAKEEILRKYKAEARAAAAKLHASQGLVKEKEMQLVTLKHEFCLLDRERSKLRIDIEAAWAAAEDGKMEQKKAAKAAKEIALLRSKHECEGRRRRQAEMELERAKLIASRDHNKHSISLIKST